MTSNNKKIVKLYLKEVSSTLDCSKSLKSVFLNELREEIENSVNSDDSISKEELYNIFGTPKDIAHGFYKRDDYDVLLKKAKRKVLVWRLIALVLIILLMIVTYCYTDILSHINLKVKVTNVKQIIFYKGAFI